MQHIVPDMSQQTVCVKLTLGHSLRVKFAPSIVQGKAQRVVFEYVRSPAAA